MSRSLEIVLVGNLIHLSVAATANAQGLRPRTPPPKAATIVKPAFESRLQLKFRDDLRARGDGGQVSSQVGAELQSVRVVQERFDLAFHPLILLPQETLDFVEQRAAATSGVAQPDFAGMMVVTGPDETLEEAAQALLDLDEIEWVQFVSTENEPQCNDLPPVTPNYFPPPAPWLSYHAADPGLNMSCAWTYGGEGLPIKVAVADFAFTVDHEDLCNVWTEAPPQCQFAGHNAHGTAVLGQLVALDNAYGCTGLVPQASPRFYSAYTSEECPNYGGTAGAILAALAPGHLAAGDVIVNEMGIRLSGMSGFGPAELEYAVFEATRTATVSNIIVVGAAANGGENLDASPLFDEWRSWGDSGAIIVGAGKPSAGSPPGDPTTRHNRCAPCLEGQPDNFWSTYGARVDVQGWGEDVFTLGYGTYCDPSCIHAPGARGYYTATFAGTSSAVPMVAGAAASLQAVRVAHSRPRLTPAQMRQVLIESGIPQGTDTEDEHIGPFPNVTNALLHSLMEVAQDCNNNTVPDRCEGGAACCLPDNSCVVWFESCCAQAGGTFLSQQTDCQTQRACCRPPPYEDCIVTTRPCCNAVGGTFKELKLTCGPATCPAYDAPSFEP